MIMNPHIYVTPDCPTIQIREARETVDLDVELPKILRGQGWSVGTFFHVQFVDREMTRLLECGRFLVTMVNENLQVSDANPNQPITRAVQTYMAEMVGPWWRPENLPEEKKEEEPKKTRAA